jgi:hypothetical protein
MPIPFDDSTNAPTATAGYLKFLPRAAKEMWLGALFIMNARGEPVEFAHARVRAPKSVMWRAADLEMRCLESLCKSMFQACPVAPDILLCLAREVAPGLFEERISPEMPVGRISLDESTGEIGERWIVEPPHDSAPRLLFESISDRGLLLEPFERAEAGLREVYKDLLR